jgi:phenylpropionate dioxygenase-like ring-hydroxylating dioxygenase large terminal subunit
MPESSSLVALRKKDASEPPRPPRDHWYVVARARSLRRRRPLRVERFGEPWVLFRDAGGRPRMIHARCPHRGVDLGLGRVVEGAVECAYHGFRFDGEGRCTVTPCEPRERPIRKDLCVRTMPVVEHRGLLFAWYGELRDALPEPSLPSPSWSRGPDAAHRSARGDRRSADAVMVWNAPFHRVLDAMTDIHHAPFAHRPWLGATGALLSPYTFERHDDLVVTEGTLRPHGSPETATGMHMFIHVSLPMHLRLGFSKRLEGVVCLCPIDAERTWIFIRYFVDVPIVGKLLAALSLVAETWLVQPMDRRMAENTLPALGLAHPDKLVRADGGVALARRLLADASPHERGSDHESRASHEDGAPMRLGRAPLDADASG